VSAGLVDRQTSWLPAGTQGTCLTAVPAAATAHR